MNKVILIGRITKDPELRTTLNGDSVTKFNIAVSRPFQDQNGERGADFINCVAWRRQAENIAKYCTKGTQVAVEGRIQTGSYDAQDGSKRYTTDIICESVTFLGSKGNKNSAENSTEECRESAENSVEESVSSIYAEDLEITDDMLPF